MGFATPGFRCLLLAILLVSLARIGGPQFFRSSAPIESTSKAVVATRGPWVTVRTPDGHPVKNFTLECIKWHGSGEERDIEYEVGLPPVRISDPQGRCRVPAIAFGAWILRVVAPGYVPSYSRRFTGMDTRSIPPGITVTMSRGGSIAGTIVDESGLPVNAVSIRTLDACDRGMNQNGTFFFVARRKNSCASTTSDAKGRFLLPCMSPGNYQLLLRHPDFVREFHMDLLVPERGVLQSGPLVMRRGGRVEGTVTMEGRLVASAAVSIHRMGQEDLRHPVWDRVYTDPQGAWRCTRQLPQGTYEITATSLMETRPLLAIVQSQESRQVLSIERGKTSRVEIVITKVQ